MSDDGISPGAIIFLYFFFFGIPCITALCILICIIVAIVKCVRKSRLEEQQMLQQRQQMQQSQQQEVVMIVPAAPMQQQQHYDSSIVSPMPQRHSDFTRFQGHGYTLEPYSQPQQQYHPPQYSESTVISMPPPSEGVH